MPLRRRWRCMIDELLSWPPSSQEWNRPFWTCHTTVHAGFMSGRGYIIYEAVILVAFTLRSHWHSHLFPSFVWSLAILCAAMYLSHTSLEDKIQARVVRCMVYSTLPLLLSNTNVWQVGKMGHYEESRLRSLLLYIKYVSYLCFLPWTDHFYTLSVSAILLRPHPTDVNVPLHRIFVFKLNKRDLKWMRECRLAVRQERGLDALEGWALKEISDRTFLAKKPVINFSMFILVIEVPIDNLLNPLPQSNSKKHSPKRAMTTTSPLRSIHTTLR